MKQIAKYNNRYLLNNEKFTKSALVNHIYASDFFIVKMKEEYFINVVGAIETKEGGPWPLNIFYFAAA